MSRVFVRRWRFVAAVALLTSGCAYNDRFENRFDRFDVAAEQSRDDMILTNIIRASHAEPLSFVQLSNVNASNTSSATMGLPSLLFGPHVFAPTAATAAAGSSSLLGTSQVEGQTIFGANPGGSGYVGNSATVSGVTSFEASPNETKDFYNGLLSEVAPRTLQFFAQQGVAPEVLFYLFTDRVVEERDGKRRELRNDPLDPNFPAFRNYVALAMRYGLSSEPVPGQKSKGGGGHGSGKESKDSKDGAANAPEEYQLCFDRANMTAPFAGNSPMCGSSTVSPDSRTVTFYDRAHRRVAISVLPRSAFAIFQYLGRILAGGEGGRIKLESVAAIDQQQFRDDDLFYIEQGPAGPCFLSVNYEGVNYCVPEDGAANTKRIIGLLTQLIALNTTLADLPITPTVRVVH
ncbi:MAG TPA: hypothetical protein VKS78_04705 [Roseiarcus sp.]|nr:hypothetical protein [Roseiarcus sp.]